MHTVYTYDGVHHTPLGRCFHARYLHSSWTSAGAKNVGVGNISPRAFRRRIVRYWNPLGCRAIDLGKPPQGGVIHTVLRVYGTKYEALGGDGLEDFSEGHVLIISNMQIISNLSDMATPEVQQSSRGGGQSDCRLSPDDG